MSDKGERQPKPQNTVLQEPKTKEGTNNCCRDSSWKQYFPASPPDMQKHLCQYQPHACVGICTQFTVKGNHEDTIATFSLNKRAQLFQRVSQLKRRKNTLQQYFIIWTNGKYTHFTQNQWRKLFQIKLAYFF